MASETSFPKNKIKVLLLEKINVAGKARLEEAGYSVHEIPKALSAEELAEQIEDVHVLGIRSKSKCPEEVIKRGKKLLAIGCFGVGTNQVDLKAASKAGIPVFNAPFSSTRSVAELALLGVLTLARKAGDANARMHQGIWKKSAVGSFEIRGKTLGLVGYGHIGQQVGLLAESSGMKIKFYDLQKRLPLGTASQCETVEELLSVSDYVSLHVPAQKGKALLGAKELASMKKGACLINGSRGSLVDLAALKEAVESGHLGGAALDVFPEEPKTNTDDFKCDVTGVENIFLTPHIGGSTEEAQTNIALEVAESFIKFIDNGSTAGSVNFPPVTLPSFPDSNRILNVHQNVPGALTEINQLVSSVGVNINAQYMATGQEVGYLIMDLDKALSDELKEKLSKLPVSVKTRILY